MIDLTDDPDVIGPLLWLRQREIVHYARFKELFEYYEKNLKNGNINFIVGTHALIQEEVEYNNLGLVITDEQHRFGVNQRSNLQNKGAKPDIIYMSATPIPRTYALTIYQDMDTSIIKTKPNGRKEIKTYVKKESELKEVLTAILEEIKKGHQVYVVAPAVVEQEERNIHDVASLKKNFDKAPEISPAGYIDLQNRRKPFGKRGANSDRKNNLISRPGQYGGGRTTRKTEHRL